MMKRTMAILGDPGEFSPEMIGVLMKQDLRLLFISENETNNQEFRERFENDDFVAEIEFLSCEREGCWEADIIAITREEKISPALVQKIKEVATQKTVLVISQEKPGEGRIPLQELLPYSIIIEIEIDTPARKFSISGKDAEATGSLTKILEDAGYQIKI